MPSSARCRSPINHRASGSEKRSRMYPRLPRAKRHPKGNTFPSLTAARDRQPSPAGGRRSARALTDPPNIFSFPPGAAHFLFDVSIWGPRRAPRGGERRSKGAGAVFAAGGNGAERTLRRRHGGCILAGPAPWREQTPRGRHRGGRDLPVRDGEFSPIRVTNPPPAGHT